MSLVAHDRRAREPRLLHAVDTDAVSAHVGDDEFDSLMLLEATNIVRDRAKHEITEQVRRGRPSLPSRCAMTPVASR